MRFIRNIQLGEVYRVIKGNLDFIGVLLSKESHLGNSSSFLTFYTSHNEIKELYENEGEYYKDGTVDKKIGMLLREYYAETEKNKELSNQIALLHQEKKKIKDNEFNISQRLAEITGQSLKTAFDNFYNNVDYIEESKLKVVSDVVVETVKDTVDIVKETKKYQNLTERLGNGFDRFWDYVDRRSYN